MYRLSQHCRQRNARLRAESLESRELLAADLATYGELYSVDNFSGVSYSEWSGATYWTDGSDEYVMILDSGDSGDSRNASVHRVDLMTGARTLVATLSGFEDSEGLTWMGGDDFAVVEEEAGEISIFTVDPTISTPTTITSFTNITLTDPSGKSGLVANLVGNDNKGIEGIAFNDAGTPSNTSDDFFYVVKEQDEDGSDGGTTAGNSVGESMGVYVVDRTSGETDEFLVSGFPTAVEDLTGLFYDATDGVLYYTSADNSPAAQQYVGKITNLSGTPNASHSLFQGSVPLNGGTATDVPVNAEGLAFTSDGLMMFTVADDQSVDYVAYRTGDMDGDGDLDVNDIDTLFAAINNAISDTNMHDIDRDGVVDNDDDDIDLLIEAVFGTYYGDIDLDGDVDDDDYDILDANYNTSVSSYGDGDLDGDGDVDINDFGIMNSNWGAGT